MKVKFNETKIKMIHAYRPLFLCKSISSKQYLNYVEIVLRARFV